jgi:hypothetical protein
MTDSEVGRTPTLEVEWEDLSSEHESRRETVEKNIESWPSERTEASYVIGAIGAGKTQLLTHLFKYSYRETSKPALYVTMGQILDDVEEVTGYTGGDELISQEELHDALETIVDRERENIHSTVSEGADVSRSHYLIDSGRITDVSEYADVLGIDTEELQQITSKSEEVILIIDEMEESYNRLGEMVAQTTGPLRETVERVEKLSSDFYLIGGFGYASVNELGEAEYRRVTPVTLPIIKPGNIEDILAKNLEPTKRNFIWWMSRGRPGWLEIAEQSYDDRPEGIQGTYDSLGDIVNLEMSRVDIIAVEELEEYVTELGEEARDLTAMGITHPAPIRLNSVAELDSEVLESSDPLLLTDSELTELDDVVDAFLSGAEQYRGYDESRVSDQLVRRYLVRIMRAIANDNDQLVFGAAHRPVFARGNVCRDRMLDPLTERIHDIALEEAGDENEATVNFLYELSQYIQGAEVEDLSTTFNDFIDLFTESDSIGPESYMGPDLRALVITFPSLITNPRLNFSAAGMSESEQFSALVEALNDSENIGSTLHEFGRIIKEGQS